MVFQSVPDTALFRAVFTGPDGVNAEFGLYSRNLAGPWDATQMGAIAQDLIDAVEDVYMPLVSNQWTFERVIARDLEPEFGRVSEHAPGAPVVGGNASPSLPAQIAVGVKFVGEPGAAPRRGRIHLLPPTEDQVVGSLLTIAARDAYQAAAEALHNAMSATGPAHVIVSRYSGTHVTASSLDGKKFRQPIKRAVAVTNTVPTVIVDRRLDSQRRRAPDAA